MKIALISTSEFNTPFPVDYFPVEKKVDWNLDTFKDYKYVLVCGSQGLKHLGLGIPFNKAKDCLLRGKYYCTITPEEANYTSKKKEVLNNAIKVVDDLYHGKSTTNEVDFTIVDTEETLSAMLFDIFNSDAISIDTETSGLSPFTPDKWMTSLGIATKNHAWTIPLNHKESKLYGDIEAQKELVHKVLKYTKGKTVIGHNGKFDTLWIWCCFKYWVDISFDTMLAHYNLDENALHGLDVLAAKYLGVKQYDIPVEEKHGFGDLYSHCHYLSMDVRYTYDLYEVFKEMLAEDPMTENLFYNHTMPIARAYAKTERNGTYISPQALKESTAYWEKIEKETSEKLDAYYPGTNWSSAKQVADVLFNKLGLTILEKTPGGTPSCSESVLKRLSDQHEIPKLIIDNRGARKNLSTFLYPWKELMELSGDDCIHPGFKIHGTVTGRVSCLRKGTQIMVPGTTKNIEDIKIGDFVYCYDENCNLTLKRVTWAGKTGIKKCIRLHFYSSNKNMRECILDVTPEHKIRLSNGLYVRADELIPAKRGNRRGKTSWYDCMSILALSRYQVDHRNENRFRNVLGITGKKKRIYESRFLFEFFNGYLPEIVHHKDHNQALDNIENLEAITLSKHSTLHGLEQREKAKHRFDRELIQELINKFGIHKAADLLNCSLKSLRRRLPQNHRFLYSEELPGEYEVYDLTVEDSHNFIANEICVHNCSDPNLMQVPRDPSIRSVIQAPPGWVCIEGDLSQAELRIAAELSQDPELKTCYQTGVDVHTRTVETLFGIDPKVMTKEQRKKGKAVNFGFIYGMGWRKFMEYARDNYGQTFTEEEAQKTRKGFFKLYKALPDWHKKQREFVHKKGYVRNLIGRKRRLYDALLPDNEENRIKIAQAERNAINSPVQSLASDINLSAFVALSEKYTDPNLVRIEGTIHDAILLIAREDIANQVAHDMKYFMEHPPIFEKLGIHLTVPIVSEVEIGPWSKGVVWHEELCSLQNT